MIFLNAYQLLLLLAVSGRFGDNSHYRTFPEPSMLSGDRVGILANGAPHIGEVTLRDDGQGLAVESEFETGYGTSRRIESCA